MSVELVTCSKIIALHCLESKQPQQSYTYHRGFVNAISINHNNKVVASCGQDAKLFLVSAEKPENKLIEHNFSPNAKEKPSSLNTCAFSPNSKYIAVGSVDSLIHVWDIRGENTVKKNQNMSQINSHMTGITSLAWVKQLKGEQYGSQILASSSSSGEIYVHSNKTGVFSEILAMKMQEGINCIKVSEGSDYSRLAACTNGGTLAIWDLLNGKEKPFWQTSMPNESKVSLTSLSISTYSPVLLVTSTMNESLVFFDIHEKKSVKTIAADQPLNCVGLHGNGHTLVAGGMYGSCFVYDLRNPSKPQNKLAGHETTIKHLQFFRARQKESTIVSDPKSTKMATVASNGQALLEQKPSFTLNIIAAESKNKEAIKAPYEGSKVQYEAAKVPVPQPKINNLVTAKPLINPSTVQVNANIAANQTPVSVPVIPAPIKKEVAQQLTRDRKLEPKLSATGQEVIRSNNSLKGESFSRFSQAPIDTNRNRQVSNVESYNAYASRQSEARELKELREELRGLKAGQSQAKKQIKNQMYEMEERLNMSFIRQMQIQYSQLKHLFQGTLAREREKDEYIKKLEAENHRLKHSTF